MVGAGAKSPAYWSKHGYPWLAKSHMDRARRYKAMNPSDLRSLVELSRTFYLRGPTARVKFAKKKSGCACGK